LNNLYFIAKKPLSASRQRLQNHYGAGGAPGGGGGGAS